MSAAIEASDRKLNVKPNAATLSRQEEPMTSFAARSHPPFEPKVDKEYVIYVPYTFEELKPHFTSPEADAKKLFCALTGNHVPSSSSPNYDYEMWTYKNLPIGAVYVAFMKDFSRGDILASRIPAAHGAGAEWTRLEFGRDLWNRGQNYSQKVLKAKEGARDSKSVKRMLVSKDVEDVGCKASVVDWRLSKTSSSTEAVELDEDSDGEWRPRSGKV
ncbi:uncharacterized protein PV09_04199 [Verruconis gallopava]|uniref:Uncharacterized protein n=1 Tax=Verruconis gallopava TaxID=253628 RepID=A0A0D2ADJ8_9PEZI|nr:uncharacterized protein PV09_04199 [Verruconis gallopava]KIW05043.1 hypothetical protein PV09_04199 [Verruconis gallopava]